MNVNNWSSLVERIKQQNDNERDLIQTERLQGDMI